MMIVVKNQDYNKTRQYEIKRLEENLMSFVNYTTNSLVKIRIIINPVNTTSLKD